MSLAQDVTVLDFDHTYEMQSQLQDPTYDWIGFTDLTGTMKYCEEQSLSLINERLERRMKKGVTFIGSGDYHYVSYLLLKEVRTPFTLLLFDNHTDLIETAFPSLITCGSWVLRALEQLSFLKKVVIIGANRDLIQEIPSHVKEKIHIFPNEYFVFAEKEAVMSRIANEIPTHSVYISIDKDVLNKKYAVTNWDHGNLELHHLFEIVDRIAASKVITGVDICGEYPYSPVEIFHDQCQKIVALNNKTNGAILTKLESLM